MDEKYEIETLPYGNGNTSSVYRVTRTGRKWVATVPTDIAHLFPTIRNAAGWRSDICEASRLLDLFITDAARGRELPSYFDEALDLAIRLKDRLDAVQDDGQ